MSEIEEADIEVEETNMSPSKNISTDSHQNNQKEFQIEEIKNPSSEKRLVEQYKKYEREKFEGDYWASEEKFDNNNLTPDTMIDGQFKTPDKVSAVYFEDSEKKTISDNIDPSPIYSITPYKQLETITEQPTLQEMDWTYSNAKHSNSSSQCKISDSESNQNVYKTPSNITKWISSVKIYTDSAQIKSKSSLSWNKDSPNNLKGGANHYESSDLNVFVPSPDVSKSKKSSMSQSQNKDNHSTGQLSSYFWKS